MVNYLPKLPVIGYEQKNDERKFETPIVKSSCCESTLYLFFLPKLESFLI